MSKHYRSRVHSHSAMTGGEVAVWWFFIVGTAGLAWPFYAWRRRHAGWVTDYETR